MPNTQAKKSLNLNLCFKKIKLSQLFSQSLPMTTPQITPEDHSRPLPQPKCSSILVRNFNSLYENSLDFSTSNSPTSPSAHSVDDDDNDGGAVAVAAAFASSRFFFSTPGRSNSIVDSSTITASAEPDEAISSTLFGNSVAVPTISPDPYSDFRRSMQEMVEAREVGDVEKSNWEFLHELLLCYLALNPKSTHKFIIGAFADLVVNVLPSPPESGGGRRESDVVADMYENKSKSKSGVLFSKNISAEKKNRLLNILQIDQVCGDEKHLGNPFIFKRRRREDYARLKDSLMKKLEGWKMKLLSYAGRLTLIKTVASSMPIYAMSTNKIPLSSCRQLDALMRKYWWLGNVEKDRFLALKAWDYICTPKVSGGLGLRRCEDINRAMLSKLAWFLVTNKDRPWVNCLLGKYCRYDDFWSVNPKSTDSRQWKGILETRDILLKGSVSLAASGSSINFWSQPWIPWLEYEEFSELMQQIRPRRYTISTLADVSSGNEWNEEIIIQIFGSDLGKRILEIPRIPHPFPDQVVWKHNAKGQFSVKSAYYTDQFRRFAPEKVIWKWIWEEGIHPKFSVLLWRILNEALPTRNRLPFVRDKDCCLCGSEKESALHLFRDCSFSKAVWLGSRYPLRIDCIPGDNMINFLDKLISSMTIVNRKELLNFIGCVFSEIWNQRNAVCARNVVADPVVAHQNIEKAVKDINKLHICIEIQRAVASSAVTPQQNQALRMFPGVAGESYVIFTDASWVKGTAGVAAIGVDRVKGQWFVKAQRTHSNSVLEAELKAILLALNWAVEEGRNEVIILSDSKIAIDALTLAERPPEWKSSNIFFDIINVSKKLLVCNFFFISRSLNLLADGMAKSARVAEDQAVLYQGEGVPPVIPIVLSN